MPEPANLKAAFSRTWSERDAVIRATPGPTENSHHRNERLTEQNICVENILPLISRILFLRSNTFFIKMKIK